MTSKILVTGAGGFLGSNLLDHLYNKTNFNICALSRSFVDKPFSPNRFDLILQDLTLPMDPSVKAILSDVQYIIHLAGGSDVKKSLKDPIQSFNNNVVATANLLEYSRKNMPNLQKFIFFSTAEVFGPSMENKRFNEGSSKAPCNSYAYTKLAAEEVCRMYANVYHLPLIVTYTMNVYGKNQANHKFVPKIINKISNNDVVTLHANLGPDKRNYLHVDDVSSALEFLIKKAPPGEDYNIVSDVETDNLEIAEIIATTLRTKLKFELKSSSVHHTRSILCNSKLKNLGWKPKISLRIGLRKYIYDR